MSNWARKLWCCVTSPREPRPSDLIVSVKTGDKRGAGTNANIWMILRDSHGRKSSEIKLDTPLRDDHERDSVTDFTISRESDLEVQQSDFGEVAIVEFWRDDYGLFDNWYLEKITVCQAGRSFYFPVHRWIQADRRYRIALNDSHLPRDALEPEVRMNELKEKKKLYRYKQAVKEGPVQIEELPSDEAFSEKYFISFLAEKAMLLGETPIIKMITGKITSLDDIEGLYKLNNKMYRPTCVDHWRSDRWFGLQRVQGANPFPLRLCNQIPDKFGITSEMLNPVVRDLSGNPSMTLDQALDDNKIFITDLNILEGIFHHPDRPLVEPLCLFICDKNADLMPMAIQLKQQKGPDNPVFLCTDPEYMWLLAKLWYNMAEAQHHESKTHLGLTHLLMEGICVCTHRNLSPSHPMFRLLAPHFLYLLAINTRGMELLVGPGEWVDECMTIQAKGMFQLISKTIQEYRLDECGIVPKEIESRGLMSKEVLPYYPYRDDALRLYSIIHKYVSAVVLHYYNSEQKLLRDHELQSWRKELSAPRDTLEGVGIQGIPGSDETGFTTVEEVVDTITAMISTCSLGHAAASFQQYEQYGFIPNYPGMLTCQPPTSKEQIITEDDILDALPSKEIMLSIMVITKLLSLKGTNNLGNFEVHYLYDDVSLEAHRQFVSDIKELSEAIQERNKSAEFPYVYLDPVECVPNSISV